MSIREIHLRWRDAPPDCEGEWWLRSKWGGEPHVVLIEEMNGELGFSDGDGNFFLASGCNNAQWARNLVTVRLVGGPLDGGEYYLTLSGVAGQFPPKRLILPSTVHERAAIYVLDMADASQYNWESWS